jgi:hypothetical protein
MQFAFLTFFLGLVSGSETVAFAAGPEVAAIEVRLDGAAVARLAAAPWEAKVDFGTALLPHHLEARALDGRGGEMARVEQWINVPRRAAEAEIVVEKAPAGQPRTVRLAWQSVTSEVPRKAELTFDGAPLKLDREYRAALPPMRGTATHVLSAELQFADGVTARHDLALGGEYDDAVATELTAVPVWLPPHSEVPPVAQLQSWFAEAGQPLQVHAVDASAPRLIAVRDPAATPWLLAIGWIGKHENNFLLSHGTRMRFIWPQAKLFAASGLPGELFGGGSSLDVAQHGIPWLLANVVHPGSDRPRLADAAAVSALDLSASAGPRAVLVVLAPDSKDYGRYDGAILRGYLEAIHMPLFVWSAGAPSSAIRATWGQVADISRGGELAAAVDALRQDLDRQRIVWVVGHHLPQAITLTAAAGGRVSLAPPI